MFESLNSKFDAIRKNNKDEWIEIPVEPIATVLFPEDQAKIDNAVIRYPMGSYQAGEIVNLSGLLYQEGIDVLELLVKWCIKHNININK